MLKKFLNLSLLTALSFLFIVSFYNLSVLADENKNINEEKSIYLTFDDGISSKVTPMILDVLKKENVKGTFFLIGNTLDEHSEVLNRMYKEGHSLGLHSYSHERNLLYNSKDAFIKEMLKTQAKIKEITGVQSTILRFPFGTRNNSFRINAAWETAIHNNNLKIYDWNVDSNDGTNPSLSANCLLKNSKSKEKTVILLMHCTDLNKNSSIALKSIIDYYRNEGYTFKQITEETEEMYTFKNDRKK